MTTFSDLPVDLVEVIIVFCDGNAAEALSRVSKSLRQLAERDLYREISLTIPDDALRRQIKPAATSGHTHRLSRLLRTLQNRPELTPAIKRVILELEDYDDAPTIARHFCIESSDAAIERCQPHYFWGTFSAFFRQLYGLERLQIPFGSASLFNKLDQINTLSNLRAFCYSPSPQYNTWSRREGKDTDLSLLYTFIHVRQLVTLDLVLPGIRLDPALLPITTSLKHLILRHSQFSPTSLVTLLGATKNLKTLQYDYDCDLDALYKSRYDCANDWGKLREGLKHVAGSLRHLSIALDFHYLEDYKEDDWDPQRSWEVRGKLGDISFLKKLESLEVPLTVLLGWNPRSAPSLHQVLPKNLRNLCLRDDLVDWFEEYPWTPWDSSVIGKLLDSSFQETVDASAVLNQLGTIVSGAEGELKSVTLLMSRCRTWPGRWLTPFSLMFRHRETNINDIEAKVLLRMIHEDEEDPHDLVKEITFLADKYADEGNIAAPHLRLFGILPHSSYVTREGPKIASNQTQDEQSDPHDLFGANTYWIDDNDKRCHLSYDTREMRQPARTFARHT